MLDIDLTKNRGVDPTEKIGGRGSVDVLGRDGETMCKR